MKKSLLLSILCAMLTLSSFGKVGSVSVARSAAAKSTVTVKGIVTTNTELGPIIKYLQDDSAGIAIYSDSVKNYKAGDSIIVIGALNPYNGLPEVTAVTSTKLISSGNPVPAPIQLSFTNAFDFKYVGMLVQVTGATFSKTGSFAGNTNYKITDGTNTNDVRIVNSTDIVNAPIPSTKVDITGIMSIFSSTGTTSGFQLLPRSKKDFNYGLAPGFATALTQSNITKSSFDVSFTTLKKGDTKVYYGLTNKFELGSKSDTTQSLDHKVSLTGLTTATIYYVKGVTTATTGDSSESSVVLMATQSNSSGKMYACFDLKVDTSKANSASNKAVQSYYTLDDTIAAVMKRAKSTLDIAIYSFDSKNLSPSLTTAINLAVGRGVKVRIVADGSNGNAGLTGLSVSVKVVKSPTGLPYGIMHNKFIVADVGSEQGATVLAGSTNWTDNQLFTDANNMVIIQDQTLAKAYTLEFEEMFLNNKFGPDKTDNTPHLFNINGNLVEAYFSPSDGVTAKAVNTIKTADKEMEFAFNLITRSDITAAIKNQYYNSKIFVAGVVGDTGSGGGTQYLALKALSNKTVFLFTGKGIFHHKYFLVDANTPSSDPTVFTGSYNFSTAAESKNDENVLIIHNANMTNQYYQEWASRYKDNGGSAYFTQVEDQYNTSNKASVKYRINGNQIELLMEDNQSSNYQITMIDLNGRVISSNFYKSVSGTNLISLEGAELKNGLYIINLQSNTGFSQSIKVPVLR